MCMCSCFSHHLHAFMLSSDRAHDRLLVAFHDVNFTQPDKNGSKRYLHMWCILCEWLHLARSIKFIIIL